MCPVCSVKRSIENHPSEYNFLVLMFLHAINFCTLGFKKSLTADLNWLVANVSDLLYFHMFVFYSISHEKLYLSNGYCSSLS